MKKHTPQSMSYGRLCRRFRGFAGVTKFRVPTRGSRKAFCLGPWLRLLLDPKFRGGSSMHPPPHHTHSWPQTKKIEQGGGGGGGGSVFDVPSHPRTWLGLPPGKNFSLLTGLSEDTLGSLSWPNGPTAPTRAEPRPGRYNG